MTKLHSLGCVALLACSAGHVRAWDVAALPTPDPAPGNIVPDPSLERDGWRLSGRATWVAAARTGRRAGRIERSSDKADPRLTCVAGPARAGQWLLSAWMKTALPAIDDPNYAAFVEVTWLDSHGAALATQRGPYLSGPHPTWVYRQALVKAPSGAAKASLACRFAASVCGRCDVDDVAMTPASEEPAQGTQAAAPLLLRPARRIFEPGETLRVDVTLPKRLQSPATFAGEILNSRGKRLCEAEPGGLPAHSKATSTEVSFTAQGLPTNEWLLARVKAATSTARWHGEVGVLIRPRPTDFALEVESPFALLVGHPYEQRWLGARWHRPNFNWNDREHELANRYGVTTLAMVNQATDALHGRMPLDAYARFVEDSVRKYRGVLRWWQMGNEPPLFQPGMAEKYVAVLKAGYQAAKRANRDAVVAMGGLTGLNVDPEMLAKFLDAGGAQWCDVIDLHMYVDNPAMDRLLAKMRRDMADRGVDKPIILTEVTAALGQIMPERDKAGHVYKRYATALSHGVKQLYWFVMHWVNDAPGGFQHCGLMDVRTRAPWPAAAAYARLSDALTGAAFERREVTDDQSWLFEFRRAGRSVWVAWAESGPPRSLALPCGKGAARLIDVAGHEWRVDVARSLVLTLTHEPVLVDLPSPDGQEPVVASSARFAPAEGVVCRGGEAALSAQASADAQVAFDAPVGLSATESRLRASDDAALGKTCVWAFVRKAGLTTAALRVPVTVTEPLSLELTPVPALPGAHASVRVQVANLSARVQNGTLRVVSPLSNTLRPAALTRRFTGLRPGERGRVDIDLSAPADPLGRYEFRAEVKTDRGASAAISRTLVFVPASRAVNPPKRRDP